MTLVTVTRRIVSASYNATLSLSLACLSYGSPGEDKIVGLATSTFPQVSCNHDFEDTLKIYNCPATTLYMYRGGISFQGDASPTLILLGFMQRN